MIEKLWKYESYKKAYQSVCDIIKIYHLALRLVHAAKEDVGRVMRKTFSRKGSLRFDMFFRWLEVAPTFVAWFDQMYRAVKPSTIRA